MRDYQDLLAALDVRDAEVLWAVRVGSHVYGTAGVGSDEDFMVALTGQVKEDLLIRGGINITLRSQRGFQGSIEDQNIFALECLYTPKEHTFKKTLRTFKWSASRAGVRHAAIEKSNSDYSKALRGPMDYKAKKRLWHSLRVPTFARQLQDLGFLEDYSAANDMYLDIMTDPIEDPEHYSDVWGPIRRELCARL